MSHPVVDQRLDLPLGVGHCAAWTRQIHSSRRKAGAGGKIRRRSDRNGGKLALDVGLGTILRTQAVEGLDGDEYAERHIAGVVLHGVAASEFFDVGTGFGDVLGTTDNHHGSISTVCMRLNIG